MKWLVGVTCVDGKVVKSIKTKPIEIVIIEMCSKGVVQVRFH
jgi:hypothetical protein